MMNTERHTDKVMIYGEAVTVFKIQYKLNIC